MSQDKPLEQEGSGFRLLYQILIAMLLIALIPLGGLYYISIHKSSQDWTDNIVRSLKENTAGLTRSVDEWTTMNFRALHQNAASPAILSMDAVQHNQLLATIPKTYEWIYLAHTILPDGNNLGRSDGNPADFYGDRVYFQQVLAGQKEGRQLVIGKTSKKPALIIAVPIKGGNKLLGVASAAMTLDDLSKTVTKTRIGQTGFAILVDEERRLIAHGDGKIASELQDFGNHPIFSPQSTMSGDTFIFNDSGKDIVAYSQKTALGWTLIVQQDYQEAFASAESAQLQATILLVATLVAVLLIAFLLALRISTPIRKLTTVADAISRGELGTEIPETTRGDEIGALARAINRMGISLQLAFERLRKR
jgi:methyl-accepting chemotaxis protein